MLGRTGDGDGRLPSSQFRVESRVGDNAVRRSYERRTHDGEHEALAAVSIDERYGVAIHLIPKNDASASKTTTAPMI